MIRILNVEDDARDFEIIQRKLESEGLACEIVRVEREEEYARAISDCRFDLIIADMSLPSFDGLRALELAKERCGDVPFIFFSGVLGEEAAVETLKNGATDYVLKQRPARLASAVRRAIDSASETRLNRLAEESRQNELRFRQAIEHSMEDGVVATDVDGRQMYVNPAFERMVGWSAELVGATPPFLYWPEEERDGIERALQATLAGETPPNGYELTFQRRSGERFPARVAISRLKDHNEAPIGWLAVVTDITERKAADAAIRSQAEALQRLSRAVEYAADIIFMTDADGTITYANPAFEQVYGFSHSDAVGRTPRILKSGHQSAELYEHMWREILDGDHFRREFINRTKDGREIVVDASVSCVRAADGAIAGFIAVQNDITEKKRLEQEQEQLRQHLVYLGKMEALGTLAGGIAHDFNNILAIVQSFCSVAERSADKPDRLANAIKTIREAVRRGADLSKRILTFARKSEFCIAPLHINQVIGEVVKMVEQTFPKTIKFATALGDIPSVAGDSSQLHEVLLNLCVNARDAMPAGGTITFHTELVSPAVVRRDIPNAPLADFVRVRVSDTGAGMNDETKRRMFEPFFTTKSTGTGLGLAVAWGVVSAMGGFIRCQSEQGLGTSFDLFLPLAATLDEQAPNRAPQELTGSGTILLVEDEPNLAEVLAEALEEHGYRVLLARDGTEAMSLFSELHHSLRAVVSDIGLPGVAGSDLFFRFRQIDESVPLVLASGFVDPALLEELRRAGLRQFLQKPYETEDLLRAVASAINGCPA
jgi:hypothetical protein